MRRFLTLLTLWAGLSNAAFAQDSALVSLETGLDSAGWEAVGRLDIADKGFCTATLIAEDLILTAAHCVYDTENVLIPADRFMFYAGLRNGRAEATRGVTRLIAHPDYVSDGPTADVATVSRDIALLELSSPIRHTRIHPFAIANRPEPGDEVGVVSYAAERADAPSLQQVCSVLGRQTGAIVMTCEVDHGSSGSPVFSIHDGVPTIVSVVSAMAEAGNEKVSLGTSLGEPLDELRAYFADELTAGAPSVPHVMTLGDRSTSGAKFVTP